MKVVFAYNTQEDANNLLRGLQSKNNSRPSRIEGSYLARVGGHVSLDTAIAFVRHYRRIRDIDVQAQVNRINGAWATVDDLFTLRAQQLFKYKWSGPSARGFLTIDTRCTYSTDRHVFYVSINSEQPLKNIMHELFHLYTWHALPRHGCADILSLVHYNDLREALTELLNVLFSDLLSGAADRGYPQHAHLRSRIRDLWHKHQDLYSLLRDPQLTRLIR